MKAHAWIDEFPGSVMVCDNTGIILEMNERCIQNFAKDGGKALLGKNVLDCHPEPSRTKLATLLQTHEKNIYTIEKNGQSKLIYQVPWFENGEPQGILELSLELPADLPNYKRD